LALFAAHKFDYDACMFKFAQVLSTPPLAIGPVPLEGRAILAPMSGVTDVGMRRVARRLGASLVVSEMVASDDYLRGSEETRLRAEGEGVTPHVVQIAGCDPMRMGEAARLAEASGADILDINMGCPAKRVTGGWAGSALMRDLGLAQKLIEATVAAVRIPVTLKMRLGWDETSCNAADLARLAERAGVRLLTVHGRTRAMFYNGKADWRAIAAVKSAVAIPVVANGDCGSAQEARSMLELSGADAVMIGRAALGRPWLIGMIAQTLATGLPGAEPSAAIRGQAAVEHYETLLSSMGSAVGLRHARKHLAAYADHAACGLPGAGQAGDRRRLVTSEDTAEVRRLLLSFFKEAERMEAA
jgi:nifR3 family TIM-barrel protein